MKPLSIFGKSDDILIDCKFLLHSIIYLTAFADSYMRDSMNKYF